MNTHIPTKPKRPKPSYKQAPKANINKFEKGNSASHNEHKSIENIKEKLRLLSLANRRQKQGISWSRNNSKSDLSSNYK